MIRDIWKKYYCFIIIMLISSISIICFAFNNYFLYKTTIVKVTSVDNIIEESSTGENSYIQKITGIIKNGDNKGKEVKFENYTSSSNVLDDTYTDKSELFVELSKEDNSVLSIIGVKRDKYLTILLVVFIDLLLIVANKRGLKTLISLLVNVLITTISILIYRSYSSKINILLLYSIISVLFIYFSIRITNKKEAKTYAAIISAITSTIISFLISFIVLKIYGNNIPYWSMEYIEVIKDFENYFYVGILLCGLGAIMDTSITMASSINELIVKNPNISKKDLTKSSKEISKDITGTMVNVMLFTVIVSIIPTVIIAIKNNFTLINAIKSYGTLELITVLTSCISIVLSIPIASFISIRLLKRGDIK